MRGTDWLTSKCSARYHVAISYRNAISKGSGIAMLDQQRAAQPLQGDGQGKFPHLLSPLRVGQVMLRNRAFSSAHGTGFGSSGQLLISQQYRLQLAP